MMRSSSLRVKVGLVIVLSCSLTMFASFALQIAESWRSAKQQHFDSIGRRREINDPSLMPL